MGGRGASSGGTSKGEKLANRLYSGETLHVRNPANGMAFSIERTHRNGIAVVNVLQDGKPVRGRSGMFMSHSEIVEWLSSLKERNA